jgi:hypothetical protein
MVIVLTTTKDCDTSDKCFMENIYILINAIYIFVLFLWNLGLLIKYLICCDIHCHRFFFVTSEVITTKFCVWLYNLLP